MHRQFKPDPELAQITCSACGKAPHYYTSPRGVFIECSPCGRRTTPAENTELAECEWMLDRFTAIGRAA